MSAGGTLTLVTQVVGDSAGRPAEGPESPATPDGHWTPGREVAAPSPDPATGRADGETWVTVSVGDTGGGIPQGIVDEVFNPFFTTKEIGTGLGLTLVRRIVRVHGGRVEVRNRPGEGVTFSLWLPAIVRA
jgi:signal transduction histidine kinase